MSQKDHHISNPVNDFLRYLGKKMTGRERNDLERTLQKDPFAAEALEGFEGLDNSEVRNDIQMLENRLRKRIFSGNRRILYGIAASVAVLMILGSVFIFIGRNQSQPRISYAPPSPTTKVEAITQDLKKPDTGEIQKQPPTEMIQPPGKGPAPSGKAESKPLTKAEIRNDEEFAKHAEAVIAAEEAEPLQIIADGKAMKAEPSILAKSKISINRIKGRVISAEDNQPIQGASITVKGTTRGTLTDSAGNFVIGADDAGNRTLVADFIGMVPQEFRAAEDTTMEIMLQPSLTSLSETVVVGYGVRKKTNVEPEEVTAYTPPSPVTGKADFDRYIIKNIRRPDSSSAGQRVVVVLDLTVGDTGNIDTIKILKSPARAFSEEAVRLVKEGPKWKPALENGKAIRDDVRLRIVFK